MFTYPDGMSTDDYQFPDHNPRFLDEVVAIATPDILLACGGNKMCIYDAVETGNIDVGLDTMEIIDVIEEDERIACECFVQILLYSIVGRRCPCCTVSVLYSEVYVIQGVFCTVLIVK